MPDYRAKSVSVVSHATKQGKVSTDVCREGHMHVRLLLCADFCCCARQNIVNGD
jgi:hypothetical protein